LLDLNGVRLCGDQTICRRIPGKTGLSHGRQGLGRHSTHLATKGLLLGLWHVLSGAHHGIAPPRPHLVHQAVAHQ
jgi:hypothetical protein